MESINLQPHGTINAVAEGTRRALKLAVAASAARRAPCPVSSLLVGVECGGSDTTSGLTCNPTIGAMADRLVADGGSVIISETSEFLGAEHLFAARAKDEAVGKAFVEAVLRLEREAVSRGMDIRGTNPTQDNIRGGLTTIEEKALGAMAKAGTSPLRGVLAYGEAPAGKGAALHGRAGTGGGEPHRHGRGRLPAHLLRHRRRQPHRQHGRAHRQGLRQREHAAHHGGQHRLRRFRASSRRARRSAPSAIASTTSRSRWPRGTRTTSELLDIRETAISRFAPTI